LYWQKLKDLSPINKIQLINLLSASLALSMPVTGKENTLDACFGAWQSSDGSYTDDMLLKEIDKVCADRSDFINSL